jgi:hypothetical protein
VTPDFHSFPREIKKLLLKSEDYFFAEAKTPLETSVSEELGVGNHLMQDQGPASPPIRLAAR